MYKEICLNVCVKNPDGTTHHLNGLPSTFTIKRYDSESNLLPTDFVDYLDAVDNLFAQVYICMKKLYFLEQLEQIENALQKDIWENEDMVNNLSRQLNALVQQIYSTP